MKIEELKDNGEVRGYRAKGPDGRQFEYHLDGTGMVRNKYNPLKKQFDKEVGDGSNISPERLREIMESLDAQKVSVSSVPRGKNALDLGMNVVCVRKNE
jgi:hypothetical protein